jgi:hypothetical protein
VQLSSPQALQVSPSKQADYEFDLLVKSTRYLPRVTTRAKQQVRDGIGWKPTRNVQQTRSAGFAFV